MKLMEADGLAAGGSVELDGGPDRKRFGLSKR
jgi:hypothetical protein